MLGAGFVPVSAVNPYWDRDGVTFEDPDGYRVVLQNFVLKSLIGLPLINKILILAFELHGMFSTL
jgi:hypothetical protein